MGCGSSKSGQVIQKPPSAVIRIDQWQHYHTSDTSHYYHESNLPGPQTEGPSLHVNGPQGRHNGHNLPAPMPPTQTRDELLNGQHELLERADRRAMNASFEDAVNQKLNTFAEETLIPKDLVTETQTISMVATASASQGNENGSLHVTNKRLSNDDMVDRNHHIHGTKSGREGVDDETPGAMSSSSFRDSSGHVRHDVDAAEMLLEKHKKDKEIYDHLLKADKMRHNITLQEKLAKRREMRKRAQAKGTITATEGTSVGTGVAIDVGESAKESSQLDPSGDQMAAGVTALGLTLGAMAGQQATVIESGIQPTGGVEAAQDRHAAVMAQAAPQPAVPETRKEAIYRDEDNIELFKDLEDFAVNMDQISSPDTTFALLMDSLLINQLSDLEKVRILFHWITKQDLNTIRFPSNISDDTPMGFLFAIKLGNKSYAELFSRLCSAAGLHAKVISGYLKGIGYIPEYKFTGKGDAFRGNWNAVLIYGQWRLIDTHWGARHILEDDDNITFEQTTVYRYEEHYFLTNPDQMIATHYPDESAWQLLQQPITLEQFQDKVKLWPLHYKMKLTLISPLNGVFETSSDGIAEFRFRTTDFTRRDGELKCELRTKSKQRKLGDKSLELYTLHYSENDMEVFRVFCPATGEYLLKIFGHSNKFSDDENFTNVALFQINCQKLKPKKMHFKDSLNVNPEELIAPFPQAYRPWGPPALRGQVQFYPISHTGPIITCDKNGEATLVMGVLGHSSPKLLQRVYDADGKNNDEKEAFSDRCVSFITTDSNSGKRLAVFKMRTPQKGIYALHLYTQSLPNGQYDGFCNYLLVSQSQSSNASPFPSLPNGTLGEDINKCRDLNIMPTGSPSCVMRDMQSGVTVLAGNAWLNGEKEAYVVFTHSEPLAILAQLEAIDGSDLSGNVLVQDTGSNALIVVRPPKQKPNVPEIGLKLFVASANETNNIPMVYQAFISCGKNDSEWMPQSPVKRWGQTSSSRECGMSIVSVTNTAPLFDISALHDQSDPSPCRLFLKGDYIDLTLSFVRRVKMNFMLTMLNKSGSDQQLGEEAAFVIQNTGYKTTVRLSIPTAGFYSFVLFGSPDSNATHLSPLYFMLIKSNAATNGPSMPRSFPLWTSNTCQLRSPVTKYLKRNIVNNISVCLAQSVEGQAPKPFPKVLLLTDQSISVSPTREDIPTFCYEWEYVPGPGESVLSLVVQRDSLDSSVNYVLQFDIRD